MIVLNKISLLVETHCSFSDLLDNNLAIRPKQPDLQCSQPHWCKRSPSQKGKRKNTCRHGDICKATACNISFVYPPMTSRNTPLSPRPPHYEKLHLSVMVQSLRSYDTAQHSPRDELMMTTTIAASRARRSMSQVIYGALVLGVGEGGTFSPLHDVAERCLRKSSAELEVPYWKHELKMFNEMLTTKQIRKQCSIVQPNKSTTNAMQPNNQTTSKLHFTYTRVAYAAQGLKFR